MQLWIFNYPVTGQKVQNKCIFMICVLIGSMSSIQYNSVSDFGVLSDYDEVTSEAEAEACSEE